MGKSLIIKGANFSENAIDVFDPIAWFVNALDSAAGPDNPEGYGIGLNAIQEPRQDTGVMFPGRSSEGHLYYGPTGQSLYRYCTRQIVPLGTLYNEGYTSIKLTPKAVDTVISVYSETPAISSIGIFTSNGWTYNLDATQKTIPITANTYILFMAKADSSAKSSVADYLDISFE